MEMFQYKAVVFDFNGTLFFDEAFHLEAWGELAYELTGQKIDQQELEKNFNGVPNHVILERLVQRPLTAAEIVQLSGKKEDLYRRLCLGHCQLVAGAEAYLDRLKAAGMPMTICSASIEENIQFFFEQFKLARWFDLAKVVYDNHEYENKVAMYQDACAILGVDPEKTRVYEDAPSGIQCALKAGIGQVAIISTRAPSIEDRRIVGIYPDFSCV